MYLKAIEIIGFKSFAEKSKLTLRPGITCVVGPNGCGKSNVIDSVRWAIGEMSWKQLRSASMVDIIFNGTMKRPASNMAQVSMTFDNAERKLPIDFNEVVVARKIFRSGESEYFLNRVQCRLRDIRDLFLDTGIGGEGYAIIDQGGIERILSANPVERREMFEEVAGVSKYKSKRDEAERKLEKVDLDLGRLNDTIVLITEQVKKLDSEARKARLYQKYRDELKGSEVAISLSSVKEYEESVEQSNKELDPIKKQITDLQTNISALEGENAALNLNLTHKQSELGKISQETASIKYQIGLLEGNIKNCENMIEELGKQVSTSQEEDVLGEKRLVELEPKIQELKDKLEQASTKLEPIQAEYNQKVEQIRTKEEELLVTEKEFEVGSSEVLKLAQKEMEFNNNVVLEESSISHQNQNLAHLDKDKQKNSDKENNFKNEISDLENKLANSKNNLQEKQKSLESLESENKNLKKNAQNLQEKLSEAKTLKASLEAKVQVLEKQGEQDPYWLGVKTIRAKNIYGVKNVLRNMVKAKDGQKFLVEEIFGKYLDSLVCDNFDNVNEAVSVLNSNQKARCRFLVLSAVPSASESNQDIKNKLQYDSSIEPLVNYLVSGYEASGKQIKTSFWVSAGSDAVQTEQNYYKDENLKEQIVAKEISAKEVLADIDKNSKKLVDVDEKIKNANNDINIAKVSVSSSESEIQSKKDQLKNLQEVSDVIAQDKNKILSDIESRKKNIEQIKQDIAEMSDKKKDLSSKTGELRDKRLKLNEQVGEIKKELENKNSALYEAKMFKANTEYDLKGAEIEINNIKDSTKKRQERVLESNEKIKSLQEEKTTSEQTLKTERDKLAQTEVSENQYKEDLEKMRKEYEDKNTNLNEAKQTNSRLEIKLHDLENNASNYKRRRTEIINNLQERWNLSLEEAQNKFKDVEIDHDRIKMMRKRIENMGAINMTAPEEYDALTERNEFLNKQIEDLNQAKQDLKQAISKINTTTKQSFKDTFDIVRGHFKEIYQILFTGGEADLVLTDPEDMLETGIDIVAQPPGKKLQNIGALSGGEKALTALSLLFSFFRTNPSPFCILDEADAPLDEANIERFVGLLKQFIANTQFIVVTHNKRTMEVADILYGITMQESGVSKVMSVGLHEASEKYTTQEEPQKKEKSFV